MTKAGLLVLILSVVTAAPAAAEVAVDLELVLAVDISGSVDQTEARQQRDGYIDAIRHPAVVQAIAASRTGKIAVTYMEWAGADTQRVVVPWRLIDGPAAAQAVAQELARAPVRSGRWTSISAAIDKAVPLFKDNGFAGDRLVIDVSGDGVNNNGRPLSDARDEALKAGIVINGLPIDNDRPQPFGMATPMEVGLDRYYAQNVIGGPGSFVIPARGFGEFREAILQKLIQEVAGGTPPRRLALAP